MKKYAFGVDIGGTSVKLGLFDLQGTMIDHWQIPTRLQNRGENILPDVVSAMDGILDTNDLTRADVSGIGLAVPGPVAGDGFVPLAVNLGWTNIHVKQEIRTLTGIPDIYVENDAKAAALGEYWKGGWEAFRSAVMITIGTAIGGAVILDGKVVHGAFGAAGELSHIQVNSDETVPCACGKYGHLQQYVSTEAILQDIKTGLSFTGRKSVLRSYPEITVKDIFDAAKSGDELALETVRHSAKILARAMAAVSCVIDPELYLIGGGVAAAGYILLDELRTEFRKTALKISEGARIEAAKTGNDAGIYGAVKPLLSA